MVQNGVHKTFLIPHPTIKQTIHQNVAIFCSFRKTKKQLKTVTMIRSWVL